MSRPPVDKRTVQLVVLMLSVGCKDRLTMTQPPPPEPRCGDAILNQAIGEECEGSDFADATCQSLGFDTGSLSCTAECKLSTTLCVKRCGNGVVDPGETCDGTIGVPACSDFGYVGCSSSCQVDRTHCVTTAFTAAPALSLSYGGVSTLGDLSPTGLGDLVMVVPARMRVETYPWTVERGFDGTTGRKLDFSRLPKAVATADLDGDGQQDIAAINTDGAIDRYTSSGTAFHFESYPDGGFARGWLGRAGQGLMAIGADELLLVKHGALSVPQRISTPGLSVATVIESTGELQWCEGTAELHVAHPPDYATDGGTYPLPMVPAVLAAGDLDGDGDLDLAVIEGDAVKVLENTGASFALKLTLTTTAPGSLAVVDLDLDGRPDLVWESAGAAQIRRNQGGFVFATFSGPLGSGPSLGMSVGDVDGDGDLDLASTHSSGGETVVTSVLVNRVR